MVSFNELPVEIHLEIISHLSLFNLEHNNYSAPETNDAAPRLNEINSLRMSGKFFYDLFKKYSRSIRQSIALRCPVYDFIVFSRSISMVDVHTTRNLIVDLLQSFCLDLPVTLGRIFGLKQVGDFDPYSTDVEVSGPASFEAIRLVKPAVIDPYINIIRNFNWPNKVLSKSELRRIEIAIVNCLLVTKHFHSLKLVGKRKPIYSPGYCDRNIPLLDAENKPVVEDSDTALCHYLEESGVRLVFDFQGFAEEFSIEEHMHMASVLDLLDFVGGPIVRRRYYRPKFGNRSGPGTRIEKWIPNFCELLNGDPIKLRSLINWALYSRCASVNPGSIGNKKFNMIARHSIYDEGQEQLLEYLTEDLPKFAFRNGLQEMCLQKVSPSLGLAMSLVMAPYDSEQFISVHGNICVFGKDCKNRLERRALLIPNLTIYGGKFELPYHDSFGTNYCISKILRP